MRVKFWIILGVLALAGCGFHVSSDPIKVEGEVKHTIVVDPSLLAEFYTSYCEDRYEIQAEVDQCVADQLALFWQAFNNSTKAEES